MNNTIELPVEGPQKFFKVVGYKPLVGEVVTFFRAENENSVYQELDALPPDSGGYVRFTVFELEVLPEESQMSCPKCEHVFDDPRHVVDLRVSSK